MAHDKIKCSECEYCKGYRKRGNERELFYCEHPDGEYIYDYFRKNRLQKDLRFLNFGKRNSREVTIKTSPAWCPKKRKTMDERCMRNE